MSESDLIFFTSLFLIAFVLLVVLFFVGVWIRRNISKPSPYTGFPLRRCSDIPYASAKKILQFVYDKHEYDNSIFDLRKAAFCRDTGRIFQNVVTWYDTISIDWTFIQKRYPGNYVSWGSLTTEQQLSIRDAHHSLEGFQTEFSSSNPIPREIEGQYVFAKPGPLYVDMLTKVLVGWQQVPDTEFEVLIVQKPKPRDF